MFHSQRVLTMLACLTLAGITGTALAARPQGLPGNYPNKPVRVIVGAAAGGGADFLARTISGKLSESWNARFVVENMASGVGGIIGLDVTRKSAPDGYTISNSSGSTFQNAAFQAKVDYDVRKDFTPIAQITASYLFLAFNPKAPFTTLNEMIAYAKANPGKVNYGSSGVGGGAHLAGEQLADLAGIQLTHIPYKGAAPAIVDAIGGRIEVAFGSPAAMVPHVRAGKLRGIAITARKRMAAQAEVPTLDELGLKGFVFESWIGWVGPAGVPESIVRALNAEVNKSLDAPEIAKALAEEGASANPVSPEQFRKNILEALSLVDTVIKKTGINLRD